MHWLTSFTDFLKSNIQNQRNDSYKDKDSKLSVKAA